MTDETLRYQPAEVSPPGDTLRDLMDERSLSQAELSRRLGRPAQAVNEILAGKKEITEDTAIELERVLQVPAHFWLTREAQYREYLARVRAQQANKSAVPWLQAFPLKAMQAAGILPPGRLTAGFVESLVEPMLSFFGVASPEGWEAQYDQLQAQFRRARPDAQTDVAAITAWLRMGEIQAQCREVPAFDAAKLESALPDMRALTVADAATIGRELTRLCAQAGVVLVFVPALQGAHVSGVARWLHGRPLIQLSLLGKWNDTFWFSFFHEVGHVLKHQSRRAVYLDDASSGDHTTSPDELEANRFASDVLMPPELVSELSQLVLTEASVKAWAIQVGLHPGIVVGQLQHRKSLPWAHPLTKLKARYDIQTKA
jgi:HTH-type transcriptional regulator/antitoxin HigA